MRDITILIAIMCIVLTTNTGIFAQDSENIEQVGRIYNYWSDAYDVFVVGDLAYIAAGISGLQILDVSDPENPDGLGYWNDNPSEALGVTVSGNYAYLAGGINGLYVISIAERTTRPIPVLRATPTEILKWEGTSCCARSFRLCFWPALRRRGQAPSGMLTRWRRG